MVLRSEIYPPTRIPADILAEIFERVISEQMMGSTMGGMFFYHWDETSIIGDSVLSAHTGDRFCGTPLDYGDLSGSISIFLEGIDLGGLIIFIKLSATSCRR